MDAAIGRPSQSLPHPSYTLDICRYPLAGAAWYTAATTTVELEDLGLTLEMSDRRRKVDDVLLAGPDGAVAAASADG